MRRKPPPRPPQRKPHGKPRAEEKLLRIAGMPAVSALFAAAPERVERLFFEERLKFAVGGFCAAQAARRKPYRLVKPDELERVAGTMLHGGIVAVAKPRPLVPLDPVEAARWARAGETLLILDGIGNPHNLGAIARSAAFFGLKRLVLSDHPAQALPSDAAYRVAEGGLEHLALYRAQGLPALLRRLARDFRIIGTAASGGVPLAALAAEKRPAALVLGNEETGLARATLDACAEIVTIPAAGPVQSLNVSVSAAILLYALSGIGG